MNHPNFAYLSLGRCEVNKKLVLQIDDIASGFRLIKFLCTSKLAILQFSRELSSYFAHIYFEFLVLPLNLYASDWGKS